MIGIFDDELKDDIKEMAFVENNCDYRLCVCVTKKQEVIYFNKNLK